MINDLPTKTMQNRPILAKAVLAGLFGLIFIFHTSSGEARSLRRSASIIGHWTGGGVISSSTGGRERTRCRSTIRPRGARQYSFSASCAIASLGLINQHGLIRKVSRNTYRGRFRNNQYNVNGVITILLQGNRQFVSLRSSKGNGRLVLRRH